MTTATIAPPGAEPAHRPPSRRGVLATAVHSRTGALGALLVLLVVAFGVLAPLLAPYDPLFQQSGGDLRGLSASHLLGTDEVGRDVFSRLLYGTREDLLIILVGVAAGSLLGTALGLASTLNRWVDEGVQRVFDVIFAFPGILIGALLAAFLGPGRGTVIAVMVLANVPTFGRLTRSAVLTQMSRDYVVAARTLGVSRTRLLSRHVLPNSIDAVIVQTALACGQAAFLEGGLSLVGFGIPQPTPSLGSLINGSLPYLSAQPWYALGPMAVIIVLVIASNLVADALNKALRHG